MGSLRTTNTSTRRRGIAVAAGVAVTMSLLAWGSSPDVSATAGVHPADGDREDQPELLLFAADGLVQDRVEAYAEDRSIVPGFRELIRRGAVATDGGLLTQAPTNTGAGWNTLSTGAWPAVAGSTNNTFHINGQPFANRTAAFDTGVLQAETLAQAAERGNLKVAQIEWAGGRIGDDQGADARLPHVPVRPRRVDELHRPDRRRQRSSPRSGCSSTTGRLRRAGAVPGAAPVPATGWTDVPAVVQPGVRDAHARDRLRTVDKYGLNAYIYDSTDDRTTNYDRVLLSRTKSGNDSVGDLERGRVGRRQGHHRRRRARRQDGGVPDQDRAPRLRISPRSACSTRPSHGRSPSWPTWPGEPGFTGKFEDYVAEKFPSSQAGDFAILEAGIVSEETYVEQGLYWEQSYHPLIEYVLNTYQPDLAMVGYPVTDEFQHQFLGSDHARSCPTAPPTRHSTTSRSTALPTGASTSGRGTSSAPTRAPTPRCASPRAR